MPLKYRFVYPRFVSSCFERNVIFFLDPRVINDYDQRFFRKNLQSIST